LPKAEAEMKEQQKWSFRASKRDKPQTKWVFE